MQRGRRRRGARREDFRVPAREGSGGASVASVRASSASRSSAGAGTAQFEGQRRAVQARFKPCLHLLLLVWLVLTSEDPSQNFPCFLSASLSLSLSSEDDIAV